jgi:hypothetical protein
MNWILIGTMAGSLITSLHDTREACEGRAVILKEQKAIVKCVEMPPVSGSLYYNGGYTGGRVTIGPASN